MSNRKNAFKPKSSNPAKYFIEWKSDDRCFSFYDKEKKENVKLPLPLKFLVLEEMHVIKGWNDVSESAIYSNEVKYIGSTPINVRSFKGGVIAEGIYKEIKPQVKEAGGVYHKSIYAMLEDGTLINISIKGSSVREWGEFTKKTRNRLTDEWITINEVNEVKKGSITYTTPVFFFSSVVSKDEEALADIAFDTLEAYLKEYSKEQTDDEAVEDTIDDQMSVEEAVIQESEADDLPF